MKTSEVLRAAKGLIDSPDKWAATGWGMGDSHDGGRRCAVHALHSAMGRRSLADAASDLAGTPEFKALRRVMGSPTHFNDSHTHAEVMAAFDRAIAAEEAAEGPQTFPSEWVRTEVPA